MSWRLAGALALGLVLFAPAGSAAICKVQGPYGPIEYECGSAAPKKEEDWYTSQTFQTVLGVVGLVGSAAGGGYAYWRVRTRRKALTELMARVDRAYQENKSAPEQGTPLLVGLRQEIRSRHDKGKMDDGHFIELDKRATEYIVRLRVLELDRRFLGMPPALMAEVRRLVGDGLVTADDVAMVDRHALAHRVPDARRRELVAMVQSWCTDDDTPALAPVEQGAATPPHKLLVR